MFLHVSRKAKQNKIKICRKERKINIRLAKLLAWAANGMADDIESC